MAAIIIGVKGCDTDLHIDGCPHVNLCVLGDNGINFLHHVPHAAGPAPGAWTWPPRA